MKIAINRSVRELASTVDGTVLGYLREQGLVGTKEGCASGDCGACTVMVGCKTRDGVAYHTRNSCITPMNQLAGNHLITVEGLGDENQLHPVQQEMITHHASQCGFCTPGFVVSLAALVESRVAPTREAILEGVSGNLCRCTGYGPILASGLSALKLEYWSSLGSQRLIESIGQETGSCEFYRRPLSEPDLQKDILENPEARLLAGGSDLMLEVTQEFRSFTALIDLTGVTELTVIDEDAGFIRIGAAVSYTGLEKFFLTRSKPFLGLLRRLGSRQIRNVGTIGGNLGNASPIADIPPVLLVWDAEIELVSSKGKSRFIRVDSFYEGYKKTKLKKDEYIARIHIPAMTATHFHRFYKVSKRLEDDISSVLGAFRFAGEGGVISEARIAFGGMAEVPVRLKKIEKMIVNRALDNELCVLLREEIASQLSPITDVRASSGYRLEVAEAMLMRALDEFSGNERINITELELDA